jgi:hypothetical protein
MIIMERGREGGGTNEAGAEVESALPNVLGGKTAEAGAGAIQIETGVAVIVGTDMAKEIAATTETAGVGRVGVEAEAGHAHIHLVHPHPVLDPDLVIPDLVLRHLGVITIGAATTRMTDDTMKGEGPTIATHIMMKKMIGTMKEIHDEGKIIQTEER